MICEVTPGSGCYKTGIMPRMADPLAQLKRRPFFFPLVLPFLGLLAAVAAALWFIDARGTTVVMVVRHAETEASTEDPNLSIAGRERAARLVRVVHEAQPVRGVDAVYASELHRTQQTAAPLAEALALPVNVVPADTWDGLPARLKRQHHGENVLVVGNSTTVPQLVSTLSGQSVAMADDEYDALYIVFLPRLGHSRVLKLRY